MGRGRNLVVMNTWQREAPLQLARDYNARADVEDMVLKLPDDSDRKLQQMALFCLLGEGEDSCKFMQDISRISYSYTFTLRAMSFNKKGSGDYGLANKIDALAELDLRACRWGELVEAGMRPISASFFMLHTRKASNNVVLCNAVLRWIKGYENQFDYVRPPVPVVAPEDADKYRKWEYYTRRAQRTIFPFATAKEAEAMILAVMDRRLSPRKAEAAKAERRCA